MNRNNGFVVITSQRSGSTWFTKLLDSHESVICVGEIFKSDDKIRYPEYAFIRYRKKNIRNKILNLINSDLLINEHLDNFYTTFNNPSGFKLMNNHIKTAPVLIKYIIKNNIKPIILIRKNILQKTMSKMYSITSGKWDNFRKNEYPEKVNINIRTLLLELNNAVQEEQDLMNFSNLTNSLTLSYENLYRNPKSELNRVFDRLEVQNQQFNFKIEKTITHKDYSTLIENYSQIKEVLHDSKFKHEIHTI